MYSVDGIDCLCAELREKAFGASLYPQGRCSPRAPLGNKGVILR